MFKYIIYWARILLKKRRRFVIYSKCLLFCLCLYSTDNLANEQWMAARNPKELKQFIQDWETRKELKTLCLLQLQKKTVPHSCYEWLTYISYKEKTWLFQYLNEKCQEFSSELNNLMKVKKILQNQHLSPFCRKRIIQKKKLIEYQLRDSPVSDIFMWYLKEGF